MQFNIRVANETKNNNNNNNKKPKVPILNIFWTIFPLQFTEFRESVHLHTNIDRSLSPLDPNQVEVSCCKIEDKRTIYKRLLENKSSLS